MPAHFSQRWHDETRDRAGVRTADSFFAQKVLSLTLDYWLDAMHRKRHLEVLLANYKAQHDTDAVTSLFAEWQHRTILQVSHGKVTATRHRAVLKRALDQWRMTRFVVSSSKDGADGHRWHEHLATSFSERHVLSRAVRGWGKRLRDIQVSSNTSRSGRLDASPSGLEAQGARAPSATRCCLVADYFRFMGDRRTRPAASTYS